MSSAYYCLMVSKSKLELSENLTIPPLNGFNKMVLFSLHRANKEKGLIVNMCTKYSVVYINLFLCIPQYNTSTICISNMTTLACMIPKKYLTKNFIIQSMERKKIDEYREELSRRLFAVPQYNTSSTCI